MKRNGTVQVKTGRERQRRRWVDRREDAIRAAGIAESSARIAAAETAARLAPGEERLERFEQRLAELETTLLSSQRRLLESQEHLARRVNELGVALGALRRDVMVNGAVGGRGPESTLRGGESQPGGPAAPFPLDYEALVQRVRTRVEASVAPGSRVSVVTRGDEDLLRLKDRTASHFPCREDGSWVGYHPEDSEAAIEHLERLRIQGITHFVLPHPSYWWLEYYEAFARYLENRYHLVANREDTGRIYSLAEGRADVHEGGARSR